MANLLSQLIRRAGINPAIGGKSAPRDVSGILPLNRKRREMGRLGMADRLRRKRGRGFYKPRLSELMRRIKFGKQTPVI